MPLDSATVALLGKFAAAAGTPLHQMAVDDARKVAGLLARMHGPGPDMARVFDSTVGAGDAAFTVRALLPKGEPRAVIVYFHGGGWVIGSLAEYDTLARILAERTGSAVVLVDYRLAPEHRFPAAVIDAREALRWTAEHLEELAGPAAPIVVAGDSAGGNLAAVVARQAGRDGLPEIAAQVLVYPVTDCDLETSSYQDSDNQLLLGRDGMVWFWDLYLPDIASRTDPDASPLRASELSQLPPAIVVTAEYDVLRDEGEAYVTRLRAAGVTVEHRRFEGQMHGFFAMVGVLPGSAEAIDYVVGHLEPYLNGARV
jgi:acetyl esterase